MSPIRIIYTRVSQASVFLPIISGFTRYKELNAPFRLFLYFFVVAAGFELQATLMNGVYKNNMPGLHLYTFVEFLGFSIVYYLHYEKGNLMRMLIGINIIIGVILALADACYINGIWMSNTLSRSYASASIVLYTLNCFYSLFQKDTTRYSWEYPMFWVSTGALIYFGLNTLYFMLTRYLLFNAAKIETLSLLSHNALNIIANCLYAQSFRCFRKQETES